MSSRVAPALVAALLLASGPARAELVTTPGVPEKSCSGLAADMVRWKPANGLPARFIAESYARGDGERWIGLGYTNAGFWSAEAGPGNDACDTCDSLELVLTRFDGKRRSFPVVSSRERNRLAAQPPEALRDLALARLWRLAASDWPAKDMKQDYSFRLPPGRAPSGEVAPYRGWMAESSQRGKWLLRFGLGASPFMCWCHYDFQGWALVSPRPGRP